MEAINNKIQHNAENIEQYNTLDVENCTTTTAAAIKQNNKNLQLDWELKEKNNATLLEFSKTKTIECNSHDDDDDDEDDDENSLGLANSPEKTTSENNIVANLNNSDKESNISEINSIKNSKNINHISTTTKTNNSENHKTQNFLNNNNNDNDHDDDDGNDDNNHVENHVIKDKDDNCLNNHQDKDNDKMVQEQRTIKVNNNNLFGVSSNTNTLQNTNNNNNNNNATSDDYCDSAYSSEIKYNSPKIHDDNNDDDEDDDILNENIEPNNKADVVVTTAAAATTTTISTLDNYNKAIITTLTTSSSVINCQTPPADLFENFYNDNETLKTLKNIQNEEEEILNNKLKINVETECGLEEIGTNSIAININNNNDDAENDKDDDEDDDDADGDNSDDNDEETLLKNDEDKHHHIREEEEKDVEKQQEKLEMKERNAEAQVPVDMIMEHDEHMRSRCSSVSSSASSTSSTSTNSSLNQLVIDQPNIILGSHIDAKTKLPLNLKRKTSQTSLSDTEAPDPKQAHFDLDEELENPRLEKEVEVANEKDEEQMKKKEEIHIFQPSLSPPPAKLDPSKTKINFEIPPLFSKALSCHEQKINLLNSNLAALLNEVRNNQIPYAFHDKYTHDDEQSPVATKAFSPILQNGLTPTLGEESAKSELPVIKKIPTPITTPTKNSAIEIGNSNIKTTKIRTTTATSEETQIKKAHYFKCASCKTCHEGWNFFLHIFQKHQRFLCLYCIRVFSTAEKLSVHLEIKHDLEQNHYNSEDALLQHIAMAQDSCSDSSASGLWNSSLRFLMCCTCQHIFMGNQPYSNHECNTYMQPCSLCGQKGRHTNNCKAHPDATKRNKLINGNNLNQKAKSTTMDAVAINNTNNTIMQQKHPRQLAEVYNNMAIPTTTNCDSENTTTTITTSLIPEIPTNVSTIYEQMSDFNSTTNHNNHHHNKEQHFLETTTTNNYESNYSTNFQGEEQQQGTANMSTMSIDDCEMDDENKDGEEENGAPKLVVPKFKLRVPKEFQKSVDAAITSSEESENEDDSASDEEEAEEEEELDNLTRESTEEISHEEQDPDQQQSVLNVAEPLPLSLEENQEPTDDISNKLSAATSPPPTVANIEGENSQTAVEASLREVSESNTSELNTNGPNEEWTPTPPASPSITRQEATTEPTISTPMEAVNEANSTEPPKAAEKKEDLTNNDDIDVSINVDSSVDILLLNADKIETAQTQLMQEHAEIVTETPNVINSPKIDIEDASDDALAIAMELNGPLENYDAVEFIRICLTYSYPLCLYCNHARRISVNAHNLLLHMIENHRFTVTIKSIINTDAEELKSNIIMDKMKSFLPQMEKEERYMNGMNYNKLLSKIDDTNIINNNEKNIEIIDNENPKVTTIENLDKIDDERIYECFMCRFVTKTHKELYLHNRKMHLRSAVLCFMCRGHFQNFSEVLCHMCPGVQHKVSPLDIKFRCCLCNVDEIPSPFRLMVHLRKIHYSCDVCLENCFDQFRLSSHVWKHKQRHMCYRCGIAYRNKMDIQKHLFWKHGTESTVCKYCMQKRWRHVYHFCIPPAQFSCSVCNMYFSKAVYLMVHLREHEGNLPYVCDMENCQEKFVSRRLLLKHADGAHERDVPQEEEKAENIPPEVEDLDKVKDEETTDAKVDMPEQSEEQLKPKDGEAEDNFEKDNNKEEAENSKIEEVDEKVAEKTKEKGESEITETKTEEVSELGNKQEKNLDSNPVSNENEAEKTVSSEIEKTEDVAEKVESVEDPDDEIKRQKKLKKKRKKHPSDFLNLPAPNLSESSDSSSDSDSSEDDNKSRKSEEQTNKNEQVPVPEDNIEKENVDVSNSQNAEKALEMWKHLLEAQGTPVEDNNVNNLNTALEYTDENFPQPQYLHVAFSDHDYCSMLPPPEQRKKNKKHKDKEEKKANATTEFDGNSPLKEHNLSSRMSDMSASSSSDSSSSSTSHSCGTNCSCSDTSDSSSSNSDSSDSESSNSSTHSVGNARKKLLNKSKESSKSPHKKLSKHNKHHKNNNNILNGSNNNNEEPMDIEEPEPEQPVLPLFIESDLATDQSDSGEDYYDQHPQKVASEFLLQQRAQVMAQAQIAANLSYGGNENCTETNTMTIAQPNLNELIGSPEKAKKKLKRKKRDKRSNNNTTKHQQHTIMENATHNLPPIYNNISDVQTDNVSYYNTPYNNNHNNSEQFAMPLEQNASYHVNLSMEAHKANNNYTHLSMEPAAAYKLFSDGGGSSSEADNSLKRSKRQRRPNKFYGYTSDDESMGSLGQSLLIGTRTFKPQPPPQLTWNKDDLPTPSKSILNNSNIKPGRTTNSSTHKNSTARSNLDGAFSEFADLITQDSHRLTFGIAAGGKVGSGAFYKRAAKKANKSRKVSSAEEENTTFPPIPRLKIKPSKLGLNLADLHSITEETSKTTRNSRTDVEENDNTSSSISSSEDENSVISNTPKFAQGPNTPTVPTSLQQPALPVGPVLSANALLLPQHLPAAPVPNAMAFNRKIPPALLPNPDFATLQYFKAYNIRYPIRPPAGARQAREGESVYCYCRCPYDEVSEMIACDGDHCLIEWFHFECVGIMMAPQGKWYCAECRGELMTAPPLQPLTTLGGA